MTPTHLINCDRLSLSLKSRNSTGRVERLRIQYVNDENDRGEEEMGDI